MDWDQEYKDWLLSLKEGDKVAINIGSYGFTNYKIITITRVTPTKVIKTDDNRQFNNKGYERGGSGSWNRYIKIEPVTDKILDIIERREMLSIIENTNFSEISTAQLREIVRRIER